MYIDGDCLVIAVFTLEYSTSMHMDDRITQNSLELYVIIGNVNIT